VSRTLNEVAAELRNLAQGRSPGDKALNDLADTLSSRRRADLVGVNLADMYVPEVMLPEGRHWLHLVVEAIEVIRDVLIFVPIIYTWWQLSRALRAYGRYAGKDPFLLAWQKGFGGRTQPLSTTALVVASIVLAVILLTLINHLVRVGYERAVSGRQQRLAVLLVEASALLNRSLAVQAPDVTKAELAKIGNQITDSASALKDALGHASSDIASAVSTSPGSKLHDMFQAWVSAARELKELGTRLQGTQEMVSQLRDTQMALSAMAQQIADQTQRLLAALEQERTLSRHEAHAHHQVAAGVQASTELLRDSLTGLNERSEQFNEIINTLVHIVNNLPGNGQVL
jgi:methyl-accepting chemotaxis protein